MRWAGTGAGPPGQTQEPSHTRAPDESTLRPGLDRPARCAADFGAARHTVGLRAAGVARRYRRPPVVSAGPGGFFSPGERLHRAARCPPDRPSSRTTMPIPPPRSGGEREDVEGGVGAPGRAGPGSALLPSAGRSAGAVHEPHAPDHGGPRGRPYAAIAMVSARSLRSPPPSPSFSEPAAVAACQAVNRADETSLREGVFLERRFPHGLFAGRARPEGLGALLKRPHRPSIRDRRRRSGARSPWLHSVVRVCHWNCAKNLQISALVQVVTPLSPEEPSTGPGMWPPSNAAHWTGYPARQPE